MDELEKHAAPAMEKLLQSDPDQLFAELGLRQKAIQADPSQAGRFETTATYQAEFAGPMDVLKQIGRSFFDRVSKDLYGIVCGSDPENTQERKQLWDAFGGGKATFAAALAAIGVSWFGWAPAISAVVAALVVKLFFKNAIDATCQVWKQHLPTSA